MQTQSANYFVDAALALDDDVQFAIYAIIQGPMTQIANESQISREDILKVLQLTDPKVEHHDPLSGAEQATPVKNAVTPDHGNGVNADDKDMRSFTTSTPVSRHKQMRLHEAEQRVRTLELELGRLEAEREDAEAVSGELRQQLSDSLKRAQSAEAEVVRLRREVLQLRDQRDELVEAKAELVLQAERVKTLEERLTESQASVSRVRELEGTVKEFERQLGDRDSRITLLLQKLSEMKNREMVNVEVETLRLRLKDAEARLAEELRDREALERDVRSQQTVVQQMQIDRRIAEKRSRSQQQHQHLESMQHFGDGGNAPAEISFDVSMSAVTTNLAPMPSNGENLGSVFHRELEAARSQIRNLEKQLHEATTRTPETDTEVSRLRDLLAQMQSKHDTMETALVMAEEAQAAADVARHHLIDDLGTLEGRLGFEVTATGLLTPEAIAFAEALTATLARRDAEVDKLVEQLRALSDVEREEVGLQAGLEMKYTNASVQTEAAAEEEAQVQTRAKEEISQLKEKLAQTSESLVSATGQISHLRERLESVEEEYRQERALSARAHHNCDLNEREARRFHALVERHRSATAAFVVGLERRGLIERGTSSSASFTESDVPNQLDSVCSQLLLSFGNLEDVLKENCRLKDEVCLLRQKVEKSLELKREDGFLLYFYPFRDILFTFYLWLSHFFRRKAARLERELGVPGIRGASIAEKVEDAQDTEDDSVAYTDLSQVSSRLPFSLPSDSPHDDDGVEPMTRRHHRPRVGGSGGSSMHPPQPPSPPLRPTAFEISPPPPTTGRTRRQTNPLPPPPLPAHPQSARNDSVEPSIASNVTQTYPAAHSGNIRAHNAKNVPTPERPEDLIARLTELRRRNNLQPFHLRTNYPVETQLQSPNELYTMLQTVHKSDLEQQQHQQQQQQQHSGTMSGSGAESRREASPMPAGRSLRPKGLQSISEVLLTGASGIIGAEHLDLSSTRARPTESLLLPRGGHSTTGIVPARDSSPPRTTVKVECSLISECPFYQPPLAFEVGLSPQHKRRTAPPLSHRKTTSAEDIKHPNGVTSRSTEEKAPSVAKVPPASTANPSTSKAGKEWAKPAPPTASNSRRPLKEATGKVNRRA
ncbi:Keratin type I cytoskeletal 12 [Taenia solium]|eukprot:TsM_000052100 transcript=TsM_000052100 gene=TsM_000052100